VKKESEDAQFGDATVWTDEVTFNLQMIGLVFMVCMVYEKVLFEKKKDKIMKQMTFYIK